MKDLKLVGKVQASKPTTLVFRRVSPVILVVLTAFDAKRTESGRTQHNDHFCAVKNEPTVCIMVEFIAP